MATGDAVFQVFQMFQIYISNVLSGCYKRRSKMFYMLQYNIRMFQAYVQRVSIVSDACFKCFHLDVAYITMATHTYFKYLFSCVSDVLDLCCKSEFGCCICCYGYTRMFQEYVSSVSVVCYKCFIFMF
jgi:hypothetical protein